VVVSGGAFGSPHLLLLSGIGPAEHLKQFGIKVIKDLPVGENLHDHVQSLLPFYTERPAMSTSAFAILNPINWMKLFLLNKGPLTDHGLAATAQMHTKVHNYIF
jgi:choline dehydrogenase